MQLIRCSTYHCMQLLPNSACVLQHQGCAPISRDQPPLSLKWPCISNQPIQNHVHTLYTHFILHFLSVIATTLLNLCTSLQRTYHLMSLYFLHSKQDLYFNNKTFIKILLLTLSNNLCNAEVQLYNPSLPLKYVLLIYCQAHPLCF